METSRAGGALAQETGVFFVPGGGLGAGGGGGTEICTSCYYLNEFADRVKAANAPLDFIAASEYSKWDLNGFAPSAPMKDTIQILGKVAQRATGVTTTPVEVHEWGELAFEMYF